MPFSFRRRGIPEDRVQLEARLQKDGDALILASLHPSPSFGWGSKSHGGKSVGGLMASGGLMAEMSIGEESRTPATGLNSIWHGFSCMGSYPGSVVDDGDQGVDANSLDASLATTFGLPH